MDKIYFYFYNKSEGLSPFYTLLPLLKVSRYILYRVYGIVICIGSVKDCIVPALLSMNIIIILPSCGKDF